MILVKSCYHIRAIIKKYIFKIMFRNKLFLGKNITFRTGFHLWIEAGNIEIGNGCFFNNYCTLCSRKLIKIGTECLFGENVKIYDHNHRFSDTSTSIKNQGYSAEAITIGNHVWIGSNVVILKGAQIGDYCVIGAGCVIKEKISNNTMVYNSSNNLEYRAIGQ